MINVKHFELNSIFKILFSLRVLYMKLIIPSTTVKSRFLKTLPVGTIYKDPRNGHSYIIEEKKINECLSKTGVPYIGSDAPIEIHVHCRQPVDSRLLAGLQRVHMASRCFFAAGDGKPLPPHDALPLLLGCLARFSSLKKMYMTESHECMTNYNKLQARKRYYIRTLSNIKDIV
jgi:hypothetical protein